MQSLKDFIKRNAPVFFLGLIITLVFIAIILSQPTSENNVPAGFKKVEEKVFESGKPKEPETAETQPTEYAPQIPSPENKGKPYFYGEYDPNLRDDAGYPIPPKVGTTSAPPNANEETLSEIQFIEQENYKLRTQTVQIDFTDSGFKPADAMGFTGGKIIWTNKTTKDIRILQTLPIHEALKGGINLKPGESFEFRPLKDKQFTYVEANSQKYGSLMISDVTQPLMRGLTGK